jgi:riboflavin synthase
MFTGLITEKGKIVSIKTIQTGKELIITASSGFIEQLKNGDSISINGVCQTVTRIDGNNFYVDVMQESLKKTTLGNLRTRNVNLELAITLSSRLGGHIVQGHIDTIGQIIQITNTYSLREFYISYPLEYRKYLAPTGSVAIDGVSLTTAEIFDRSFKVALIPHTLDNTLFTEYKVGDKINIEFDIIGKYVEQMIIYKREYV